VRQVGAFISGHGRPMSPWAHRSLGPRRSCDRGGWSSRAVLYFFMTGNLTRTPSLLKSRRNPYTTPVILPLPASSPSLPTFPSNFDDT
jgi:hypothetical protein